MSESGPGNEGVVRLVTENKGEAEIAADLKVRLAEALKPVLELMDEANRAGLLVRWDAIGPAPPMFKNTVVNLRIEKHY